MFPEVISNGLASLQEGKLRYVKTRADRVHAEPAEGPTSRSSTARSATASGSPTTRCRRFSMTWRAERQRTGRCDDPGADAPGSPDDRRDAPPMRDLALLLRKKRFKRGVAGTARCPRPCWSTTTHGRVSGAHFAEHDLSHQIIEEFMLAANEAVAEHFTQHDVPFLRRVHPAPNEEKLEAFAQFADLLGYQIKRPQDRFELAARARTRPPTSPSAPPSTTPCCGASSRRRTRRSRTSTTPWPARTTATSPRRSAATRTCRSTGCSTAGSSTARRRRTWRN